MHRDSIIVVGADAGALARLVERMNARGFALNLSGGSRRSGSTGSWPPTGPFSIGRSAGVVRDLHADHKCEPVLIMRRWLSEP